MTIAEKIRRAKTYYDEVYEAGKAAGGGEVTEKIIEPFRVDKDIYYDYYVDGMLDDRTDCDVYAYKLNGMFGRIAKIKVMLPADSCIIATDNEIQYTAYLRIDTTSSDNEIEVEIPIKSNSFELDISCVRTEGYPQVTVVGSDNYYDSFWDAFQDNGNRKSYLYGFSGDGWTDKTFQPKYNIAPTGNIHFMFAYSHIADVKACLESCGVTLDLSKASGANSTFAYGRKLTTLPKIDLSSSAASSNTFANSTLLKTIEELVVGANTTFSNSFNGCTALENLIMTGILAKNGFNVKDSTKLSKASIESIVSALSSTTSGLTVTISKTAKEAAFTDAEWSSLIATKSNWTISLV